MSVFRDVVGWFSGAIDFLVRVIDTSCRVLSTFFRLWQLVLASFIALSISIGHIICLVISKIASLVYNAQNAVPSSATGSASVNTWVDYIAYMNYYIPIAEIPAMFVIWLSVFIACLNIKSLKYWFIDRF